jgi:hypothetical protein
MTAVARWLLRHALIFILIVAALAIYANFLSDTVTAQGLTATIERLSNAETELRSRIDRLNGTPLTPLDSAQRQSDRFIARRIATLNRDRQALIVAKPGAFDLVSAPRATIIASIDSDIRIDLIDRETAFLARLRPAATRIAALDAAIAADDRNLAALATRALPYRYSVENGKMVDLAALYRDRRAANIAARTAARAAVLASPRIDGAALAARLAPLSAAITAQRATLAATMTATAGRWYDRLGIAALLWPAFFALIGIILTPFAIRTAFYWLLAPLAARQRPVQLLPPGTPIPPPDAPSAVSLGINLADGQELLVKQGFLQASSHAGAKADQMLLDWRFPITSIAAGLWFLARLRGGSATVSATTDPFAELARLVLPAGATCVLQPRAIVGVIQPIGAPLRITSHWRLGTLNAWLTWQWRYLAFHGPAEVILKGGRGLRFEAASAGLRLPQDQLIGFSAGLRYATARAETFRPYLFGLEPLLKDSIAAGDGLIIAEEAPRATRAGRQPRSGIEGLTDAVLKLFGI